MKLLVTGGAGFIGSHFILDALRKNIQIVSIDNFSNSDESVIQLIKKISKKNFYFYNISISDHLNLKKIFREHKIDIVVHFAALKSVPESLEKPSLYIKNNFEGSKVLFNQMLENNVNKIIFSSSASVYGDQNSPLKEDLNPKPLNPYAESKVRVEEKLLEISNEIDAFRAIILRYFNPVGCDSSYEIGEIQSKPANLFPIICSSISEKINIKIYGNDYDTHDGTPVRDFIHISDLINGHMEAMSWFNFSSKKFITINLGTGKGYSVLDIIYKFEELIGKKIDFQYVPRRDGDPAVSFADNSQARKELKWMASKGLNEMCRDSLIWHQKSYLNNREK